MRTGKLYGKKNMNLNFMLNEEIKKKKLKKKN